MSLRARTSVLDEWWRLKVTGNEWIWASLSADWVSLSGELHLSVVHCLFLLVTQSVI